MLYLKTPAAENTGQWVDSWSSGGAAAKEIWSNSNPESGQKEDKVSLSAVGGGIRYLAQ